MLVADLYEVICLFPVEGCVGSGLTFDQAILLAKEKASNRRTVGSSRVFCEPSAYEQKRMAKPIASVKVGWISELVEDRDPEDRYDAEHDTCFPFEVRLLQNRD